MPSFQATAREEGTETKFEALDRAIVSHAQAVPDEVRFVLVAARSIDASVHAFGDVRHDPHAASLPAGAQFGRYVLARKLGEGGMGIVYVAIDPILDRPVALKWIRLKLASEEASDQAKFQRAQALLVAEAQSQAKVIHPNIVAIYDVGVTSAGFYLAMEQIRGQSLRHLLDHEPQRWRSTLRLFLQIAHGLAAAHRVGLVHRDIKPDNILIDSNGQAKIADFGLASGVDLQMPLPREVQVEGTDSTDSEYVGAGTPAYMAPEQHRGTGVDARSDQFSFFVSLYEALHGNRPYSGSTRAELVRAIRERRLVASSKKPNYPGWIAPLLHRGLSPDPRDRYPSMQEVIEALDSGLTQRRSAKLAAAGIAGMLIAAGTHHLHQAATLEARCQAPVAEVEEIWSPAVWESIERSFMAKALKRSSACSRLVSTSGLHSIPQRAEVPTVSRRESPASKSV
jgi:serine/threonine protein kinase